MTLALVAVNAAFAAACLADTGGGGLVPLCPGGIADARPHGVNLDMLVLGGVTEIPDNVHAQVGRELTQTFVHWTQTKSKAPGGAVAARLGVLFDMKPGALTIAAPWRVSQLELEFAETERFVDPGDGSEWRMTPIRFRVNVHVTP